MKRLRRSRKVATLRPSVHSKRKSAFPFGGRRPPPRSRVGRRPALTKKRVGAMIVLANYARVFGPKEPGRKWVKLHDRELLDAALRFAEALKTWRNGNRP